MPQLHLSSNGPGPSVGGGISPLLELGAYEALWCDGNMTVKRISEKLERATLPSELVDTTKAREMAGRALQILKDAHVERFGVRVHGDCEYPQRLRDARHPVDLFYYCGWWNLVEAPCVAVVGTRKPTADGIARTKRLVRRLVEDGWTIVSGLAEGIDTVAHETAIEAGGSTIGVLGTPISDSYPRSNRELQQRLARDFLIISQVPVVYYSEHDYRTNRNFFPERNLTMSALTKATIIVEAGETSGTLVQARGALAQGRELFILESCFQNKALTWPERFEKRGAHRVRRYEDVRRVLGRVDQD